MRPGLRRLSVLGRQPTTAAAMRVRGELRAFQFQGSRLVDPLGRIAWQFFGSS
jgi:hypothetical protein